MLRSNMSAIQGLAEGVIPVGVALFLMQSKHSLLLENNALNLAPKVLMRRSLYD